MERATVTTLVAHTAEAYEAAFDAERRNDYPAIDAFEERCGFALDRGRLEAAARVLACPLKPNGPNWQHGRVLYAIARSYMANAGHRLNGAWDIGTGFTIVDIGTAKGFSALCLQWALNDSGRLGAVISCDVIDPKSRERRNTIAEVDGYKTLAEILEPWPEAQRITFLKATGVELLERHPARVNVAFIDGKHTGAVVYQEGTLLAARQQPGDLAIFDDVHIDGVAMAVKQLKPFYKVEEIEVSEHRKYAIGVRRG